MKRLCLLLGLALGCGMDERTKTPRAPDADFEDAGVFETDAVVPGLDGGEESPGGEDAGMDANQSPDLGVAREDAGTMVEADDADISDQGAAIDFEELPEAQLRRDVLSIFERHCWMCDPSGQDRRVDLQSADGLRARLVQSFEVEFCRRGDTRQTLLRAVAPTELEASVLWRKINALDTPADCGREMPPTGTLLNLRERRVIAAWIVRGAPDN